MFQRILVPVDNSRYSDLSLEIALGLAQRFDGTIVGFHVYAARLHEGRFQQLETSLPPRYHQPGVLERQRQVHASLILQGLELISRSYLQSCAARCREREVAFEERLAEGKNYAEIVKEAGNGYDLVVLGAKGLGEEEDQPVGSVCLRAVRRLVGVDTLVVREEAPLGGLIMAALDGSACSRRGFLLALSLAKAFSGEVAAVAAHDPVLHSRIFRNLVDVLSNEAGRLFHYQEQERLHEDVIDQGMGKLCQEHLDWAQGMARQEGVAFHGEVLQGKAAIAIAHYLREHRPRLLVMGRFGSHQTDGMDLGSTAEALLLSSPCNLLIAANGVRWSQEMAKGQAEGTVTQGVQDFARAQSELPWSPEARERMERVPPFLRGMVLKAIEGYARMKGATEITSELVEEAKAHWDRTGNLQL